VQQENTAKSIHIFPRALIVHLADLLPVQAAPLPVHIAAERQVVIQIVFVVHLQKVLVVTQVATQVAIQVAILAPIHLRVIPRVHVPVHTNVLVANVTKATTLRVMGFATSVISVL
jgi:hypothetical protein